MAVFCPEPGVQLLPSVVVLSLSTVVVQANVYSVIRNLLFIHFLPLEVHFGVEILARTLTVA